MSSLLCLASIFSLFFTKPSEAAEKQILFYDVYAGGIHAVAAEVEIDTKNKKRYGIIMDAYTRGFLGRLVPWKGTFESHGWKSKDHLQPELHRSAALWRGEEEIREFRYKKNGSFKSLFVKGPEKEIEEKETKPELTKNSIDVLTAALHAMKNVTENEACTSNAVVFDGKRSFEMNFQYVQDVELKSSKYNIYDGPAQECFVEVVPLKGKWHEKPRGWLSIQEQGRKRGTMPTVWMAKVGEDQQAIPVKIRVKTDYGTLFMHLAEYHEDEKILIAKKRQ